MPPVVLTAETSVDQLVIDGWISHRHKRTTRVPDEPVEHGRNVSDHVQPYPPRLYLRGVISDFNGAGRGEAAVAALDRIHDNSELLTVTTEWATYENMVIAVSDASSAGRGGQISLELVHIRFAEPPPAGDLPEPTPSRVRVPSGFLIPGSLDAEADAAAERAAAAAAAEANAAAREYASGMIGSAIPHGLGSDADDPSVGRDPRLDRGRQQVVYLSGITTEGQL